MLFVASVISSIVDTSMALDTAQLPLIVDSSSSKCMQNDSIWKAVIKHFQACLIWRIGLCEIVRATCREMQGS